jgi:long-chain acyl-CoA synthetase
MGFGMNTMMRWCSRPLRGLVPARLHTAQPEPDDAGAAAAIGPDVETVLRYPSTTFGALLDQSAARFADVPAVIYCDTRWTYGQLLEEVNRLAAGLAAMGVQPRDRVLLTLPNCPQFITSFMAVQKLGAVVVNAGPLISAADLRELFRLTTPRMAVGLDLQIPMLSRLDDASPPTGVSWLWVSLAAYQQIFKRIGYRAKLWQARSQSGRNGQDKTYDALLEQAAALPPTVAPSPDDTAVLQPTGGTTGTLKVARLTHRNLLANALQLTVTIELSSGQERMLAVLPMFHVYGLTTCLTTSIMNAATILPVTRFVMTTVLDVIETHRPTIVPLAPAILEPMCAALSGRPRPAAIEALGASIVTSGAAPLAPQTARRFREITGANIAQGYGLTEASPVTHANPIGNTRDGSIGMPLPDTLARVVDLNDPELDVPAGESGQLLVSGPQVMAGYENDPEQTAAVFSTDPRGRRWLHTGDVVLVDEDGFYFVIDRLKDMINCGGFKVYPHKVETVLLAHPLVKDAGVVGVADVARTQIVVAKIVPEAQPQDAADLSQKLRLHCRAHLAPYEVPGKFDIVDHVPRTALGKLQRHRLHRSAAEPLPEPNEAPVNEEQPNEQLAEQESAHDE